MISFENLKNIKFLYFQVRFKRTYKFQIYFRGNNNIIPLKFYYYHYWKRQTSKSSECKVYRILDVSPSTLV